MIDIGSLAESNRVGDATGLPCFCTANEHVLRAILDLTATRGLPTVIEATCNQVNQEGGYTGMAPDAFMSWVRDLADEAGAPADLLVLGGDHLGPNPWRAEAPSVAMDHARELVRRYAQAGFRKIHLDASMACGGEPPLSVAQIAERAAQLCAVVEAHAPDPSALVYIIGTEVPIPGGETEEPGTLDVTSPERLHETIETHREAFSAEGLDQAWSRIVSVVTQPGVDFSHTSIHEFEPQAATALRDAIEAVPGLTFEAHSTDYQPTDALRALVETHFFFLKVGPEMTFRFREAAFALADMEAWVTEDVSRLRDVIEQAMASTPAHWSDYYRGTPAQMRLLKCFSYSDRIRYYWNDPEVAGALQTLLRNLSENHLPDTLVSQYCPDAEFGGIPTDPDEIIRRRVQQSASRYFAACGYDACQGKGMSSIARSCR